MLSAAPGLIVTEVLFLEQVNPEGQVLVRLKVEEVQPAESLLVILKVKVLLSPGFPVWGELVGVTVGLALVQGTGNGEQTGGEQVSIVAPVLEKPISEPTPEKLIGTFHLVVSPVGVAH